MKIQTCRNSSAKNYTCKPQNVIDEVLKTSYFSFYSTDYLINIRNFTNPGTKIGRNYFMATTPNIRKGCVKYLASSEVISDEGWILKREKKSKYSVYSNDKESFEIMSYNEGESKTLFTMLIRKQNTEKKYHRTYQKIQSVFAEMGGFMNIIFLLFHLISSHINHKMLFQHLADGLFNFENEKSSKDREKDIQKAKSIILETNEEELNTIKGQKDRYRKEKLLEEVFKSQDIPLQMSLWDSVKAIFSRNEKIMDQKKQMDSAHKSILQHLGISHVLKKILELEKLKFLLLDEDQYYLFELLPKPIVRKNGMIQLNANILKNRKKESIDVFANKDQVSMAKTIKNAYDNISAKTDKNEVDKRLLKFIDEDLKMFFDGTKSPKTKTCIMKEGNLPFSEKVVIETLKR